MKTQGYLTSMLFDDGDQSTYMSVRWGDRFSDAFYYIQDEGSDNETWKYFWITCHDDDSMPKKPRLREMLDGDDVDHIDKVEVLIPIDYLENTHSRIEEFK